MHHIDLNTLLLSIKPHFTNVILTMHSHIQHPSNSSFLLDLLKECKYFCVSSSFTSIEFYQPTSFKYFSTIYLKSIISLRNSCFLSLYVSAKCCQVWRARLSLDAPSGYHNTPFLRKSSTD